MSSDRGVPRSGHPECPYGEDCDCGGLTRHQWHTAYLRAADVMQDLRFELRMTQQALTEALAVPRPRLVRRDT